MLHTRKKGDAQTGKNLAIRMRISFGGNSPLDFSTGQNIDAKWWDTENECAKKGRNGRGRSAAVINRTIEEYRVLTDELFARYELLEKRFPTPTEVKVLFNNMIGRSPLRNEIAPPVKDFFQVFDLFTQTMGEKNQWSPATYAKFKALRRHFMAFNPNISLASVNDGTMQDYVGYMNGKGFRNITVARNLSFARWFFRWAAHEGFYTGTVHETFRPKLKGADGNAKEVIYLTREEIKKMQERAFGRGKRYLERVRDVFLFTCFTGLRYSDVAKLKKTDVKNGAIYVVTQKTAVGLKIELNKHSQAILDKYIDTRLPKGMALPVISNAKMNKYLKVLGQVCELNELQRIVYFKGNARYEEVFPKWSLLTTHCGRRTFVVTALQLGIPAEVIIRWTGHSDYKAMKPYVKIVDELKERSMSMFNAL